MLVPDLQSAARVVFETTDKGRDVQLTFLVPAALLWSGAGLAELFETCRKAWCGPEPDPGEPSEQDRWRWLEEQSRWEDWHLVSIHSDDKDDPQIVLNDWNNLS
jgi:hypothetical protein